MKLKHLMVAIVILVIAAIVVDFSPIIGYRTGSEWWNRRVCSSPKKGLDIKGGLRVTLQCQTTPDVPVISDEVMTDVIKILRDRVDAYGVTEPEIRRKGADQVIVELPDVDDFESAREFIKKTALLRFVYIRGIRSDRHPANYRYDAQTAKDEDGRETVTLTDVSKGDEVVDLVDFFTNRKDEYQVIVTGADLVGKDIASTLDPSGEAVVSLRFNKEGAKKFSDFTRDHRDDILAIELDNVLISAPYIRAHIRDGQAQISGNFKNVGEAAQLATLLRAGSLPVPLNELEITKVDATLGKGAEDSTVNAGVIGALLVIAFMLIFYRLPGVLSSIALAFYALLTLMLFKLFGFTLSLPGIAGFILSIGMAVDANILIFERMREELRGGKTLHSAIDAGFARAWPSIRDSNISTWLTCAVLYGFGSGPIRGFAVTLALGVAVSMFTAITVTRTMLHLITRMEWTHKAGLYGVTAGYIKAANIRRELINYKWVYLTISAIIILPGLFFWGAYGLNKGIDFEGGNEIELRMANSVSASQISEAAARVGIDSPKIKTASGNDVSVLYKMEKNTSASEDGSSAVRTRPTGNPKADALIADIKENVGPLAVTNRLLLDFERPKYETSLRPVLTGVLDNPKITMSSDGKTATVEFATAKNKSLKEPEEIKAAVNKALQKVGPVQSSELIQKEAVSFTEVGPVIAKEMARNAFLAILWASVLIVAYLGIMFRQAEVWDGVKYGLCAVGALLHDVAFVTGVFAILGRVLGWQVDGLFITALLTTIGFSVHDTIVVYDRIRENLKHRERGETFDRVTNRSLLQTFRRSVFTSFTVVLTLVALIVFGAGSLREFNFALLIGVVIGTYSSIFNATPLVVIWEQVASRKRRAERAKPTAVAQKPLVSTPLVKSSDAVPTVGGGMAASSGSSNGGGNGETSEMTESGDRVRPKAGSVSKKPKRKKRF